MPKDGLQGLKENWQQDALSGFIVFLLALPLSLGIAKASEFPPIMGLITAMIGGVIVSIFAGSRLTIKGPAAGLIVIVAGAVAEFGGGENGWHLALGAVVVAGLIQVLFGLLKLGKFADIFPLSAVHGMLAAIGIIIIAKQIHILFDIDPATLKGKEPLELIAMIPHSIMHLDPKATLVGGLCLLIILGMQYVKHPLIKKIPAPLLVLMVAIPAELILDFEHTEPKYALVHIGNLLDNLAVNVSFSGVSQPAIFIKYVIMFALVGSLESLLTAKAIDMADPYRRKSDFNKDLIAVGIGNVISGILGGLPMISEVARSSANVGNGAKTRWANFFHGLWMVLFVILAAPIINLIPNTALAAMLIMVGIKLAHPKEFLHMWHVGKEQLLIFVITIFFTLSVDLLVGIGAGMLTKILIHMFNGASLRSIFRSDIEIESYDEDIIKVEVLNAAVFLNFLKLKKALEELPTGKNIIISVVNSQLIDHTVMDNLTQFQKDYVASGGSVAFEGIENMKALSNHELATRKRSKSQ